MQERQKDRARYFSELAHTSEKYFIPYISPFMKVEAGMNVLEIGCGDGGNLLPFARPVYHRISEKASLFFHSDCQYVILNCK